MPVLYKHCTCQFPPTLSISIFSTIDKHHNCIATYHLIGSEAPHGVQCTAKGCSVLLYVSLVCVAAHYGLQSVSHSSSSPVSMAFLMAFCRHFTSTLYCLSNAVLVDKPYRQNTLATTLVQPLVALVQAGYYPRVVATAFHWLLGSRHVLTTLVTTLGCDYPSNYPSSGR